MRVDIDHRGGGSAEQPLPPVMPSACGSGCGCGSTAAPEPQPDFGEILVNGVEIEPDVIAQEIQHHPAGDAATAWRHAARALVVRELLLQEVARRGLQALPEEDGGRREAQDEAQIRALLAAEVTPVRAGPAECGRYYHANLHRFRTPDLFEASHILFEPRAQDAASWDQAEAEARAIAAELGNDPADFAAAAREFSSCPTRQQDGSLGQVRRGELVAEVQAALEALPEGCTGDVPVRSRFGWHVLRHQRTIPGRALPLELVSARIADMLDARAWTMGAASYVIRLAGRSDIKGIVLEADELAGAFA